jgi:site-specific DNA-methyltransferase (adenine-specific)
LEDDFNQYVNHLLDVFVEVKRALKTSGTCFVNIGDTYGGAGHGNSSNGRRAKEHYKLQGDDNKTGKLINTGLNKSMLLIPYRFAIGMVDRGWKLRNVIIWHKPNQLPQGVTDRFTNDFEPVFFFTKSNKYSFSQQFEAYDKPLGVWGADVLMGRNMRAVWSVNTKGEPDKHYACYPQRLVSRMIKAGCPEGGIVLDPFMGSGTTAVVARKLGRNYTGFELNPEYVKIADRKLNRELGLFA